MYPDYLIKSDIDNINLTDLQSESGDNMTTEKFLSSCNACGGNWTAMLLSGIKTSFPDTYDKLDPNKKFTFIEVVEILQKLGVEL